MKPYLIISDGACSGNPGPGGWGMILVTPQGHVKEFGGDEDPSTNNRMELIGFLRGMQEVYKRAKVDNANRVVRVISDSKYVLENAEIHAKNWAKRNWLTSSGSEVKNQDLWERVLRGQEELQKLGFKIEYELVKGHSGNEGNERADQIAVKFSKKDSIKLYDGPLSDYPVSVETGAAFTAVYLSLVAGKLQRHATWPECQKAVEGKPGAKYKKIKNGLEERNTLKAWGLHGE